VASKVLAYLSPDMADAFRAQAEAAGRAFRQAGVQYTSDVTVSVGLGHQVALRAIAYAKTDGSNVAGDGSVPTGPCKWTGTAPVAPTSGTE
jgi:hypothetical protein